MAITNTNNDEKRGPLANLRISDSPVVLAVDDMAANLTKIANMLPEDYEVLVAKSGEEALEALTHSFADVALLDIEMPDMSGIELFEKMQANAEYKGIPVIFVTSDKASTTVQKAITMGAKGYIVKPFDEKTLVAKISHTLAQSKGNQALFFLRRKMREIIELCRAGDVPKVEETMAEIPKNVYNSYVFLMLNRVLFALHNRDFKQAREVTDDFLKDLEATKA